ncbi:MAG: hypothetical protein OXG67_01720 [bacterium]|nr:hypothetical protein [bacterium]
MAELISPVTITRLMPLLMPWPQRPRSGSGCRLAAGSELGTGVVSPLEDKIHHLHQTTQKDRSTKPAQKHGPGAQTGISSQTEYTGHTSTASSGNENIDKH